MAFNIWLDTIYLWQLYLFSARRHSLGEFRRDTFEDFSPFGFSSGECWLGKENFQTVKV